MTRWPRLGQLRAAFCLSRLARPLYTESDLIDVRPRSDVIGHKLKLHHSIKWKRRRISRSTALITLPRDVVSPFHTKSLEPRNRRLFPGRFECLRWFRSVCDPLRHASYLAQTRCEALGQLLNFRSMIFSNPLTVTRRHLSWSKSAVCAVGPITPCLPR